MCSGSHGKSHSRPAIMMGSVSHTSCHLLYAPITAATVPKLSLMHSFSCNPVLTKCSACMTVPISLDPSHDHLQTLYAAAATTGRAHYCKQAALQYCQGVCCKPAAPPSPTCSRHSSSCCLHPAVACSCQGRCARHALCIHAALTLACCSWTGWHSHCAIAVALQHLKGTESSFGYGS